MYTHFVKPRITPKQTASPNVSIDQDYQNMLTQFVHDQKQDDWDTKLDKLSFTYKTVVHAVTKFSPFELMFGRIPKLPIDLVYDQTNLDELRAKIDVEWIASDFVDQQKKKMKAMLDFAAANCDVAA